MGNSTLHDKYNLRGNVDISIKLDKVCYFPGEQLTGKILITPNFNLFEEAKRYCEIIKIIVDKSLTNKFNTTFQLCIPGWK